MIDRIKSLLKAKAARNGIWLYCAQIFNLVCPMLSLPYVTRILGADKYGVFSIALNIITYLQVLVEYGFGMSATRKIAQSDDDSHINRLFSSVLLSRGLLLILSIMISVAYIAFANGDTEENVCIIILSLTLVATTFQLNWLFHGKQDMMYPAILTMVSRMLSLIFTIAFVKAASDIYLYCVIYSVFPLIGNTVSLLFAKKQYKIKLEKVSISNICCELKDGWYVFTTQMSSKVFAGIGVTFLGIFATTFETGVYSTIQKIPYILTLIWSPIGQVIYPMLSQKYDDSFECGLDYVKKMMRFFVSAFFLMCLLIGVFAKPIVYVVFGNEYVPFFYWIYPQLLWAFFGILNNFLGVQILLASGYDKVYARCFYMGVVFNIAINLLLIMRLGGWGASIAPLCSEVFLTVLMLCSILKIKKGFVKK